MIQYCSSCLIPTTRPDQKLNEDMVCNACLSFRKKAEIDWDSRRIELENILNNYKNINSSEWNCIVPVSGGKDSTIQVLKMLELGMKPLCVTASTCHLSEVGRKNIENLKYLGVDLIEFSPDLKIRKQLNRIGLTTVGDIAWPEHVGIFTIPVNISVKFKIPLIIWGESSQNEYGGPASAEDVAVLDRSWLEEFGGLNGLRVSDISENFDIDPKRLTPYYYPSDEDLKSVGTTGIYLGYYTNWNPIENAFTAREKGFKFYDEAVEGSLVAYENLDNLQHGIHDYFKFLKYGFGRATDQVSYHIRRSKITREEGLKIVKERDGKFPWTYLGVKLEDILNNIDMNIEEFEKVADQFTNKKLFILDDNNNLVRDNEKNLKKINYDNL